MKRSVLWSSALLIVLALLYVGLWIYSHQWFEREIDRLYAQDDKSRFEFLGPRPIVTGFPFVPKILYTGGFQVGSVALVFPEASVRGYPIPGMSLHLDMPRGVAIEGLDNITGTSLDTLQADITVPSTFPADITHEDLLAWQQVGGQYHIRNYKLTKGALQSEGSGLLTLDERLQPIIQFESRLTGYQEFIQSLQQQGLIEPFPAIAATGILNSLAKPDDITGENTVSVTISLKNQTLNVGPLQVAHLPEIVWDRRSLPDQHQ